MQKINTIRTNGKSIFKGQLTIGLDLGDRSSSCCVLNAGEILLEQKLPTTPEAMKQTFERMPRSRMAMETGTHSPWVSRLLTELEHEVIVAHARNIRLIGESRRKENRFDARTLARLARIDPAYSFPLPSPPLCGQSGGRSCVLVTYGASLLKCHAPDRDGQSGASVNVAFAVD